VWFRPTPALVLEVVSASAVPEGVSNLSPLCPLEDGAAYLARTSRTIMLGNSSVAAWTSTLYVARCAGS
jgi:hypothetical protein